MSRTGGNRVEHAIPHEGRRNRGVAGANTLAHGDDIGAHILPVARQNCPGPAQSCHHLVGNEKRPELLTKFLDAPEISGRQGCRAKGRAPDRLQDDSR